MVNKAGISVLTIDAHAAGEPCRMVVGGLAPLHGKSLREQRDYLQSERDWIRTSLMREPRGHGGMFGALMVPPVSGASAYGLIFMDPAGYLDGCGHGTLCSVVAWKRMVGEVPVPFEIDNADDSTTRVIAVEGDYECATATLAMPPAVVLEEQVNIGNCNVGLARCGNTYLLVAADQVGISNLKNATAARLQNAADTLLRRALSRFPQYKNLEIALYQDLYDSDNVYATAVIFNGTQIDRSPCGTGSSSLVALLRRRGEIRPGDRVRTVGPVGESFNLDAERVDGTERPARYEVRLTGTAYITGVHQWIFSAEDPLRAGFTFR